MTEKFMGVPLPKNFEYWDHIEQFYWKFGVRAALTANGITPETESETPDN